MPVRASWQPGCWGDTEKLFSMVMSYSRDSSWLSARLVIQCERPVCQFCARFTHQERRDQHFVKLFIIPVGEARKRRERRGETTRVHVIFQNYSLFFSMSPLFPLSLSLFLKLSKPISDYTSFGRVPKTFWILACNTVLEKGELFPIFYFLFFLFSLYLFFCLCVSRYIV